MRDTTRRTMARALGRAYAFQIEHRERPWHTVTTYTTFVHYRGRCVAVSSGTHPVDGRHLRDTERRWNAHGRDYLANMAPTLHHAEVPDPR